MNVKKVVGQLEKKYPGKNIILNDPDNPMEIICEVEPGKINPDKSVAVVVLDRNVKHFHRMTTEVYEVIQGNLEITKGGKIYYLHPGERIKIEPGEHHLAKGKETWVKVTSTPGWTPEYHILVNGD